MIVPPPAPIPAQTQEQDAGGKQLPLPPTTHNPPTPDTGTPPEPRAQVESPPQRRFKKTPKAPRMRVGRRRRRPLLRLKIVRKPKVVKPKGTKMQFFSIPEDASITIDGKAYGNTPKSIHLLPRDQHYKLIFRKKGYAPYTLTFRIQEDEPGYSINGVLNKKSPRNKPRRRAKPRKGYLTAKGNPIARIAIDGKDTGRYILLGHPLSAGKHTIQFTALGGKVKWSEKVTIRSGKTKNLISQKP
ncbi:MAG TPA: hypothetical protein DCE42_15400 [Myxococcales bacterium]|nr:hypothetical protein [Myxococcales bacterium]